MGVVIDKANRTATRMLRQSCCHGQLCHFGHFVFCFVWNEAKPLYKIFFTFCNPNFLSLSLALGFELTMDNNGHPILSQYYVAGPIVSLH